MRWVEIIDTISSGGQKIVARCSLQSDGTVLVESADSKLKTRLQAGVLNRSDGNWAPVTPRDGLKFLRALPSLFHSADRWATDVQFGEPQMA
ncbi:MAG: hypothetical protein V1738_01890 [Patescibacteria group bacterium]